MFARLLLFAILLALTGPALAVPVYETRLYAFDSGHYFPTGEHFAENRNYAAGKIANDPIRLRNFFFFYVGHISDPILSATLRLDSGVVIGSDNYSLTDISIDPGIVLASHAAGEPDGQAVYGDLITGFVYGNQVIEERDYQDIEIELNAKALQDLNAADGLFGIGGYMRPGANAIAFLDTASPRFTPQLVMKVPEPSSAALLLIGIALLLLFRRRPIAA